MFGTRRQYGCNSACHKVYIIAYFLVVRIRFSGIPDMLLDHVYIIVVWETTKETFH